MNWIAGNQRKLGVAGGPKHAHVIRFDNFLTCHLVAEDKAAPGDQDLIARLKLKDSAEKSVTMPGDDGITRLSGQSCVGYVAGARSQLLGRSAFQDDGLKVDLGNGDAGENRSIGRDMAPGG